MTPKYDKQWDKELKELMQVNKFKNIDGSDFRFSLGKTRMWCANYPYACFTRICKPGRPSRFTILAAAKKFKLDVGRKPL